MTAFEPKPVARKLLEPYGPSTQGMIRIWVGKFETGALDDDVQAADLLQEYEAKIAALERMVGGRRWKLSC